MRNEYTDYIAHGHKYFAVIDLGKKNSKGTKLRRYFYSANEYKNYLAGKKTLDDKLMDATAKAYKKVKGFASAAKTMPKLAKAVKNTNKEVKALKKSGLDEESARDEIRFRSADQHLARAGLKKVDEKGDRIIAVDKNGKNYRMDKYTREITKPVHQTDPEYSKDQSKELIKKNPARAASKIKMPEISNNNSPYGKIGKAISNVVDKTVGERIREGFMERMIEKGINKANAEKLRDQISNTIGSATKMAKAANVINKRLGGLQDAVLSGDSDKILDIMDSCVNDSESLQKDLFDALEGVPLIDAAMKAVERNEAEHQKKVSEMEKHSEEKVKDTFGMSKDEVKKKLESDISDFEKKYNDLTVLTEMGKKTLDTAVAGPKTVASSAEDAVDEYLKAHGMTRDGVSKEFLDELRENLKHNRK